MSRGRRADAQVKPERFRVHLNKQVYFALYLNDGVESDDNVRNAIILKFGAEEPGLSIRKLRTATKQQQRHGPTKVKADVAAST